MTEWLGNALVYERHREKAVALAAAARNRGDEELAADHLASAEVWRRRRDLEQRCMQRRQINRAARRRRYLGGEM